MNRQLQLTHNAIGFQHFLQVKGKSSVL